MTSIIFIQSSDFQYIRHITFQSKKLKGLMFTHCLLGNTSLNILNFVIFGLTIWMSIPYLAIKAWMFASAVVSIVVRNTLFRKAPPSVVSGYDKRSIKLNKVVATFEKQISWRFSDGNYYISLFLPKSYF
jgi:hypothetical protein